MFEYIYLLFSKEIFSNMKVKNKRKQKKNAAQRKELSKTKIDSGRKKQLLQANDEENRTIKRLEKLLKLNKNKKKKGKDKESKKKISSGFVDDGLDYLLEVIDNKDENRILSDDSLDLDEDLDAVGRKPTLAMKRKQSSISEEIAQPKKQRTLTDLLKEKGGYVSESGKCGDDASGDDSDSVMSNDDSANCEDETGDSDADVDNGLPKEMSESSGNVIKKKDKSKVWEDIYGRFRDTEGNVINKPEAVTKYVPPSLRKTDTDNQKQEQLQNIKRNLKGLLNRLSEANMQPICHQVEGMYMKYSRNDINETLFSLVSDLVLTPVITAPRLILEEAMLVSLLHANIGPEVGAYFLQHLVEKLDSLFNTSDYGEGKICNNVLTFISHLYNFKVTHSTLIFDIFRKLINSFQSKDIELIQLFLKTIGFVLRKDDPLSLKEVVLSVQAKASSFNKDQNDSRVKFMLETLTVIRNNNIYKIPDYDPSIIEHSKKILRGFVRKGCTLQELAVSYEDLLKAEERGRWWIVGSAWSERDNVTSSKENKNSSGLPTMEYSEKILQLAQKQHMNTDVRKSVFCIIMTAEDFMDAFEKLLRLNLKNQQEREIINVLLHCLLQEKNFNPYYAFLAGKFSTFARKYQMTLQFSLWDKFKELSTMKPHQIKNLAKFLSHCFTTGALPLSVLKVIHFSEMDKTMLKFFRQILLAILLHESEETCAQAFKRISSGKNLNLLRESLRLFMHHFLLKNLEKYSAEVAEKLQERVKLAESILTSAKNAFKL